MSLPSWPGWSFTRCWRVPTETDLLTSPARRRRTQDDVCTFITAAEDRILRQLVFRQDALRYLIAQITVNFIDRIEALALPQSFHQVVGEVAVLGVVVLIGTLAHLAGSDDRAAHALTDRVKRLRRYG